MSNAEACVSVNILYIGGFLDFCSKKSMSDTALLQEERVLLIDVISLPTDMAFFNPEKAAEAAAIQVTGSIIRLASSLV